MDHSALFYIDAGEEPTAAEIAWAAEYLADLPTHIEFDSSKVVDVWQDDRGDRWRRAGKIVVSPFSGGRFKITLRQGATTDDLARFENWIEWAKEGRFVRFGWEETTFADSPELGYRWALSFPEPKRAGRLLVECRERACPEAFHPEDDQYHVAEEIKRNGYELALHRFEHWEQWCIYVAGETDLSLASAAGMASDLQWLAAECRKLNNAAESSVAA
jgi:hypothetical protein